MKRFFHTTLLVALLAAFLLPAAAHARTYDVFAANVPFKFTIGDRTFGPGRYQFVFVGNGLLALRDSRAHVVASLVTRSVETGNVAPTSRLVFHQQKNHHQLAQLVIENRTQVIEIVGEELAVLHAPPQTTTIVPDVPSFSFSDRQDVPRLRE